VILRRLPPHCLAIRVLRLEPVRRATTLDAGFTGYVAFCRAHELTPADARRILINGATGFVGELGAEDARAWTRGPRDRARSPNGRPRGNRPPSISSTPRRPGGRRSGASPIRCISRGLPRFRRRRTRRRSFCTRFSRSISPRLAPAASFSSTREARRNTTTRRAPERDVASQSDAGARHHRSRRRCTTAT
jgi:hypothetical protein